MNHKHPTPEQLCGLATGRLDEDVAVEVNLHLAACKACRTAVENVSDDAFMALLKQAAASAG
jgi:anti-sigma factor RsiW